MNREELKRIGQRTTWLVSVFLGAALVISAVEFKQSSHVEELDIVVKPLEDGSLLVKPEDIRNSINRSFGFALEGLSIKDLEVDRLEKVLEKDPLILNADAYVDARNVLHIKVYQRQPVLRVIDQNGLNYYLDKDGFKMPLSPHFSVRVLVASGYIPPHVPDFLERKRHRVKDVFLLAKELLADPFLNAMVEQIYVTNTGEIVFIPMVGDQKILFGPYRDSAEKLRKLRIFYKEVVPYKGWRKYDAIDLRYRGQVVGR